jgi:hypothetical protein
LSINKLNMERKTKTRTEQILKIMRILAWVALFGLIVEAGATLISYGVSWVRPEAARNLYGGLNLYDLRQFSFMHYTVSVFFVVLLSCMKAFVAFLVIKTLSKVNLMSPFKIEVARILERISYVLIGVWIIAMVSNAHTRWLLKTIGEVQERVGGGFILVAGLVFIMSQVFKRGVEIQSENDLTI